MSTSPTLNLALNVLVVDDASSVRRVMRRLLGEIGFTNVVEAQNGVEAFEKMRCSSFDLVISDWNMPVMGGFELLEQVRSDERYSKLPFIMITANKSKQHEVQEAKRGVSCYISKPFTVDILKAKLEQVLLRQADAPE